MEVSSRYRDFAKECESLAKDAKMARYREVLREMAEAWMVLAEEADQTR
jgi:hypothetical protein